VHHIIDDDDDTKLLSTQYLTFNGYENDLRAPTVSYSYDETEEELLEWTNPHLVIFTLFFRSSRVIDLSLSLHAITELGLPRSIATFSLTLLLSTLASLTRYVIPHHHIIHHTHYNIYPNQQSIAAFFFILIPHHH